MSERDRHGEGGHLSREPKGDGDRLGELLSGAEVTRRAFIGGSLASCLAWPAVLNGLTPEEVAAKGLLPIRKRLPNPFVDNGKPIVVVVRGTDFPAMLAKGMEILGGFARLGSGRSVIVKPNFVFDKRTRYPTTTDEKSVLTTVKYLQKEGFKQICVADRRGKRANGRAGGKFEWSGLNDKAEAGGFTTDSLMDNEQAEAVQVRDGRWEHLSTVGVIRKIFDAGLIINMPTLKRHTQTNLTCALKNNMGVLDVPTTNFMHLWVDENTKAAESKTEEEILRRLSLTVAEAAMAVSPELTIVDARTVLCRNHLSVARGGPREANRLIISGDPLAVDVLAARLLKEVSEDYQPGLSKDTFEYAGRLGVGEAEASRMVIKEAEA